MLAACVLTFPYQWCHNGASIPMHRLNVRQGVMKAAATSDTKFGVELSQLSSSARSPHSKEKPMVALVTTHKRTAPQRYLCTEPDPIPSADDYNSFSGKLEGTYCIEWPTTLSVKLIGAGTKLGQWSTRYRVRGSQESWRIRGRQRRSMNTVIASSIWQYVSGLYALQVCYSDNCRMLNLPYSESYVVSSVATMMPT